MKLIFLDIDGVLNSSKGSKEYLAFMEVEKLKLLKELIIDSNADGVVITSDRRYSQYDMEDITLAFDMYEIFIVGLLRNPNDEDFEDNRGKQIRDYLENSKDNISSIVILDDNDDGISELFPDEFIEVSRLDGLTSEIVDEAIKILN